MPCSAIVERERSCGFFPHVAPLWIFVVHLFFFPVIFLPADVRAFETDVITEFEYTNNSSTTTDKETGDTTESDFSRFDQLYRLGLSTTPYPYLTISGGGLFESDNRKGTFEGLETETTEQTIRPYAEFNLNSPLYGAGITYRDTEIKDETTGLPTTRNLREDLNVNLRYNPAGLPSLKVYYNRVHSHDDPKTIDILDELTTVKASYLIKEKHPVNYSYSRNESDDRLSNTTVLLETHRGNIGYSRSLLDNRLSLNADYRIRYSIRTIPEDSEVDAPLLLSEGLFSADDTPQDGPALNTVTALIDGNITASSGINIGWTNDGEDDRNIGIDFGLARSVDKLFIYVDRNVPSTAVNAFSWSVYTSPDNTDTSTWTLHATVVPAQFGAFQNRFEISFPEVDTRFIKVVTSPLPTTFINNPDLENIFITEIEAFVTTVTTDKERLNTVDHSFGTNLTYLLADHTTIGYNFFYTQKTADPSTEDVTYSNGVFLNHVINRVFSFNSRITRDDREETVEDSTDRRESHSYAASLRAHYLETFQQTLTYNIGIVKDDTGKSKSNSVFLRNNARLYSGWDAYFDAGYVWSEPPEGGSETNVLMKTGTDIKPNRKISFNANYTKSVSRRENDETETTTRQIFEFISSYLPYRTLSFSVRLNFTSDEQEEKVFQNYSVNWSPFPDGDLQFFSSYSETRRRPDDQKETVFGPGLRWQITRYALLNMSYYFTTVETAVVETDSQGLRGNLRMNF